MALHVTELESIALFLPPRSQYEVLHHFTRKLGEALTRQGLSVRLLEAQGNFLRELLSPPPDLTLSFNGLLPDAEGTFFCDRMQIPHVAYLVDSPNLFRPMATSPMNLITCVDREHMRFFQKMGAQHAHFLPHAVEKELHTPPQKERCYPLSMLSSFSDPEILQSSWNRRFSSNGQKLIKTTVEETLAEPNLSHLDVFTELLSKQEALPEEEQIDLLDAIEHYLSASAQIELVQAVAKHPLHLFGSGSDTLDWQRILGKKEAHVTAHGPKPFSEAIEIFKQSRITLNCCPKIRDGGHERIYTALACGSLPLSEENPYLSENFMDRKSILFYSYSQLQKLSTCLSHFLENEEERIAAATEGQKIVQKNHTWDQRAQHLIDILSPQTPA